MFEGQTGNITIEKGLKFCWIWKIKWKISIGREIGSMEKDGHYSSVIRQTMMPAMLIWQYRVREQVWPAKLYLIGCLRGMQFHGTQWQQDMLTTTVAWMLSNLWQNALVWHKSKPGDLRYYFEGMCQIAIRWKW